MKKVFLLIFCGLILGVEPTTAKVRSIVDMETYRPQRDVNPDHAVTSDLPDPDDQIAVRKFFKERIENAAVTQVGPDDDYTNPSSINVVHTPEYYRAQEEQNKPLFQKMYEEAVRALQDKENNAYGAEEESEEAQQEAAATATRFFTVNAPKRPRIEDKYANEAPIPTVAFSLPSGRRMLAPALEHIPYFLSYIDIEANGYLKIEDTVIVVADGKKFAQPMQRIFSKYAYDKNGHAQRIEIILTDVKINDTEVAYTTEEFGNNIILKPKYKQTLEPGVYTYTFNYLVNHQLHNYENNVVMNWNITGRPLNAFITSANAIITLPTGKTFKNVQGIIGKNGKYTNRRSNILPLAANVAAISNFTPLLNGENMNLVAIADKKAFLADFNNSFTNFMFNWGNILYAALGFIAILAAYLLSLINLKREQKNAKYTPSYNGSLMRQILVGKYDKVAFTAQILDLFRKQALDILQEDNHIFLIRKNINSARLNKIEKKALKRLFAKKTEKLEICSAHSQLLKNVSRIFAKYNMQQIKKFSLMHNIGYIVFSSIMLILTEIFIALISSNPAQMLIILLIISALYAFYVWILRHKFKHWYVNIPIKVLTLTAVFAIWLFSSIYTGGIANLLILLMIVTIFAFTEIFNKRNNFANEATKAIYAYKEYLLSNSDALNISRDFINHQSGIFALDIVEHFSQNVTNKNYYRLETAEIFRRNLVGMI